MIIFNKLDINTYEVLEAAGTKWNFLKFFPGLVGGHCIGVDPYYLTHKAQEIGYNPEIILAGRRLNDNMGSFVAGQIVKLMIKKEHRISGSKALVLGITFKENCPDIRNSKLPDPKSFGNGGSFFRNPRIGRAIYNCIRVEHPNIPYFPDEENRVKIPAAWLIEKAGWKDFRVGNVGTWPTQPLVIVNYGGATGREIYDFSEQIVEDVDRKFGVRLEREVQLV